MKLRKIEDAPIFSGTHVLVRIDADVVVKGKKITPESAYRLDSAVDTLKFLLRKKAVITIIAHRGRPEGKKVASLSLAPAQSYLEKKLKTKLRFLPNVRFDAREEKNDLTFARELAIDHEVFVNESFATAHRKHASTHAITRVLPAYAGIRFQKEVLELQKVEKAKKPIAVIIGGEKVETKVPVIKKFLSRAEHVFVVGAAGNAFFSACGYDIGGSLVDKKSVAEAKKMLNKKNMPAIVDVMIGKKKGGRSARSVAVESVGNDDVLCGDDEAILDIGPATLVRMSEMLRGAKTIIWNGPLGVFERPPFDMGTSRMVRMLSKFGRDGACVIAGGGETVSAILEAKMQKGFTHISTGGGAMLEFLSGKSLPAIEVLIDKK